MLDWSLFPKFMGKLVLYGWYLTLYGWIFMVIGSIICRLICGFYDLINEIFVYLRLHVLEWVSFELWTCELECSCYDNLTGLSPFGFILSISLCSLLNYVSKKHGVIFDISIQRVNAQKGIAPRDKNDRANLHVLTPFIYQLLTSGFLFSVIDLSTRLKADFKGLVLSFIPPSNLVCLSPVVDGFLFSVSVSLGLPSPFSGVISSV